MSNKLRLLIGLVLAVALALGASPDLRAAAKAAAKATAKAAGAPQGGKAQKAQNPGQTVKQKKQLAVDRQAAAKKAAAAGFQAPLFGAAAMQLPGSAPFYYTVANWANSPWPVVQTSGAATVVGNATNADRAYATDFPVGVGQLAPAFVVLQAPLTAGTLTSFQTWNQTTQGGSPFPSAGNVFHAYVLRPAGVDQYQVVFDSGLLTVPVPTNPAGEVATFPVAAGVTVLAGDLIAFYGQGIPLDVGGANADLLVYPAPAAPILASTITLGSAQFPKYSTDRTYSLAATVTVNTTQVVGGIRKFVDTLPGVPGVTPFGANNLGQFIPAAVPEEWCTRPEAIAAATPQKPCIPADYYEIGLVQHREKMHSDLPPTLLREYVQLSTTGAGVALANASVDPLNPDTPIPGYLGVTAPHYLGPTIVATKDRPVRIKFVNLLPTGEGGNLFLPVDTTFMGAGPGPLSTQGEADPQRPACGQYPKPADCYTENRATLHLHGGLTPWISDGTPHQWITPAGEGTPYPKGVSVRNVPDMGNSCDASGSGCQTFYYTNQQSARLLFYHDHAWGITRLNVYAGEAAGYVITDATEQKLIGPGGPLEGLSYGIPLVIQDRTFVPDPTQLAATDPQWDTTHWGGKGSLWLPHVYMPIQNPDSPDPSGFGRWFYGPWFWPPITLPAGWGAIPNPNAGTRFDGAPCVPGGVCEPGTMPGTPFVSSGMEAYNDTPVVNGTAYPTVTLEPKAYRFRILNAANDRFFNLQWYVADGTGTEVALNAAQVAAALNDPAGVTPGVDRTLSPKGPDWVQIGTEGGFLPAPALIPGDQETTFVTDPGRFDIGNVDLHSLLLGSAERADVIVDFSAFAGKTLILYNDAPAAFPARDPRYDLYTGNADQRDVGGPPSTMPGYGPNTRTIMQVKIAGAPASPFNVAALEAAFAHQLDANGKPAGVFESSQHPIVVGQAGALVGATTTGAYNFAYGTNFSPTGWCNNPTNPSNVCDGFVRIFEQGGDLFGFNTLFSPTSKMAIPLTPKGLHDEPNSSAFDDYGRMQATIGVEAPGATPLLQNIVLYPFPNPPTELIDATSLPKGNLKVDPISVAADGTQIWKITHNGVDTHPIHFHLYDVQLLNRSPWDGQIILPPDANELGWKDTVRIAPLEDTYVALRPVVPALPFDLPNSIRVMNPMLPEGSDMRFNNVDINGNPTTPVLNVPVNFGWEYVWHCHILSHEEMDMMRPQSLVVPPNAPVATFVRNGNNLTVTWGDNSLNETAFVVQRNDGTGWVDRAVITSPTPDTFGPNLTYVDALSNTGTYTYRVVAQNTAGYGLEFPSLTAQAISNAQVIGAVPAAPTNLATALLAGPQVRLTFTDNANNETGFVIQRCTGAGCGLVVANFAQIALAPPRTNGNSTVTFTDATVASGNSYSYRVAAINGAGSSAYTLVATRVVPAAPTAPAVPSSLTAANGANQGAQRRVVLNWAVSSTANLTGFTIEWATDSAFTLGVGTTTAGAAARSLTVSGLVRNTYYYFRIKATNTVSGVTASSGYRNAVPFPIKTNQ